MQQGDISCVKRKNQLDGIKLVFFSLRNYKDDARSNKHKIQGDITNVFLARHVSGTYAHHQEHWMLSCSIWFSAPSCWMGGGLESRCVGRVYGADGAVHHQVGISSYFNTSFVCACGSLLNAH